MTDNENIKGYCERKLCQPAQDIINHQKAEIENHNVEVNKMAAEIDRLRNILLAFMDEVSKWENKHGLDISELPLIPIRGASAEIKEQIKAEAIKEFVDKLETELIYFEEHFIEVQDWSARNTICQIINAIREMVGESNG